MYLCLSLQAIIKSFTIIRINELPRRKGDNLKNFKIQLDIILVL